MKTPKNEFKVYDETDKKCYFYDITDYMKYIIGDFVSKADNFMGYTFNEDTDFEQKQDFNKFKEIAIKIDTDFDKTKRIPIEDNTIIRVTFNNKKRIEISAMDYGYIRES